MRRFSSYLLVLALLAGCNTELTREGESVRVVESKSGLNYEYLGPISVQQTYGNSDGILAKARNKAAEKGANAIHVTMLLEQAYEISLTADALRIID